MIRPDARSRAAYLVEIPAEVRTVADGLEVPADRSMQHRTTDAQALAATKAAMYDEQAEALMRTYEEVDEAVGHRRCRCTANR